MECVTPSHLGLGRPEITQDINFGSFSNFFELRPVRTATQGSVGDMPPHMAVSSLRCSCPCDARARKPRRPVALSTSGQAGAVDCILASGGDVAGVTFIWRSR